MFPRNSATPLEVGIGEVVLKADGTIQTADVLVRVKPEGGAWGAGAGTLSVDATTGHWSYRPTQGETDATGLQIKIYKADCLGASATIVFSAASTAGQVVTDTASREASKATGFATPADLVDILAMAAEWGVMVDGNAFTVAAMVNAGGGGLDAAGVRDAVGLAAADLDAQLGAIKASADAAAGASGGTGARTVTITVDDGTTALEGAKVRLTKGAESYMVPTNVDGQAVFNIDDGTWAVAITLSGYVYAGTTLVVDGDATETYSLVLVVITPPVDPDLTVVRIHYDDGVTKFQLQQLTTPEDSVNKALYGDIKTFTKDGLDYKDLELFSGAEYRWRAGTRGEQWVYFKPTGLHYNVRSDLSDT
jgi:hypothetical protein